MTDPPRLIAPLPGNPNVADGLRAWLLPAWIRDCICGKEVAHERMEELGPVILMDGKRLEAGLTSEGRKVTERIRADMGG